MGAQPERVALLHLDQPLADAVEPFDHGEGLGVADDAHVGVEAPQRLDRRGVVGLHVVDDQIVDGAVADFAADVLEKAVAEVRLDRVDQRDLLADDQVGVVGDARRQRPQRFEAGGRAVVDAYVADAGSDFRDVHAYVVFRFFVFLRTKLQKIFGVCRFSILYNDMPNGSKIRLFCGIFLFRRSCGCRARPNRALLKLVTAVLAEAGEE